MEVGRREVVEVTRTSNLIMSSKSVARCIVCKRTLDFEVTEWDRFIDDNIWYCDECWDIIEAGLEDEYDESVR